MKKSRHIFCHVRGQIGCVSAQEVAMANFSLWKSDARRRGARTLMAFALLASVMLLALPSQTAFAQQDTPTFSAVDPLSGKVNDEITVTGSNLGKSAISAVFLSDEKNDYKAAIVEQTETKIVMKVPQVKPGSYNVSYQKGNSIYIQPVRFTVE
jgi:IPT/TIG domain